MDKTALATKNQQELFSSLLNDFSDIKDLFEYEDYIKNLTVKNGSVFNSEVIDRNMDRLTNRENYMGYLANRYLNKNDYNITYFCYFFTKIY